jgi:hypothetical protein
VALRSSVAPVLLWKCLKCLPVVSLLVGGCGASPSQGPEIRFDPCEMVALVPVAALPAAAMASVSSGLASWNRTANTRLFLATAATPPGSAAALPIHFQSAAAPFHGFYDQSAGEIFINVDLVEHARSVAIAHEVGHAFGLVHVSPNERSSVMNVGNLDEEPNTGDVEALARLWGHCPAPTASSRRPRYPRTDLTTLVRASSARMHRPAGDPKDPFRVLLLVVAMMSATDRAMHVPSGRCASLCANAARL